IEPEIVDEIADADRDDNRLVRRGLEQGAPVEEIEGGVGHEDEIDRREMMNVEPRLLQTLDHFQPLRPDWIDQEIELVRLDQERGVADPGDADLALADFRELRTSVVAGAFREKRGDEDLGEKIALVPIRARDEPDAGGTFVFRAV